MTVLDQEREKASGLAIIQQSSTASEQPWRPRPRLVDSMSSDSPPISLAPAHLAQIMDLAPSFMAVMRGPQHVFEVANKAYQQLVGNRPLLGLPVREAIPEIEGQGFFELLDGVYTTGRSWIACCMPIELIGVSGGPPEVLYLDFVYQALRGPDDSISGIFAHGIDVTAMKVAQDALHKAVELAKQEARTFNTTLSAVTDFVYTFDRDGKFLYSNKALLDLLGLPLDQLVGKDFFELNYPHELAARLQRQIQQVIQSGEVVRDETPFVSPAGVAGFYEYMFCPVFSANGNVELVAGSTRDITVRKSVEATLREADRNKSEFLAMLAHELRNPIAPIRNGLAFLQRAGGEHPHAPSLIQMMDRQVTQMVHLIDDLLDISRISRGKIELRPELLDLADVVQQAVEAAQPFFESMNHELTVTLPAKAIHLNGDRTRLAQVAGNLLNNACKFTERGGLIKVIVERDGEEAIIRVADSGIGLSFDDLPRIFEMFAQIDTSLDRSRGGLGIGLTLVKELVDMHGGAVEAHSEGRGKGSEFVVRLPFLSYEPDEPQAHKVHAEVTVPRHILVVDDNVDATESLAALLQFSGHTVDIAHDGVEGVEAAIRLRPAVVLLDIGLPRLDGYSAAKLMRQALGSSVMLVAMTGWGRDDDRQRASEAGFDAHLTKPVNYGALVQLLAQLSTEGQPVL